MSLGRIMAELAQAEQQSRMENLEAMACPLCRAEMEYTVAWFCYGGPPHRGKCQKIDTLREVFYRIPWDERLEGHPANDFQGQTLAAIIGPGPEMMAELVTVRGSGGRTNIKVRSCVEDDADLPRLAQELGWTWMEWAKEASDGQTVAK